MTLPHSERKRAWIVLAVAVLTVATLVVMYYLGHQGNVGVA